MKASNSLKRNKHPRLQSIPAIRKFSPETIKTIGSYVYALVDPDKPANDPRRFFYVGKGIGNRCFSHAAAALRGRRKKGDPSLKLKRIRKIKRAQALRRLFK